MSLLDIVCRNKKMKEIELSSDGTILEYKKGYTPEFVKLVLDEKNLKGLRVFSVLKENRIDNLDFLTEYNFLTSLIIACISDPDFAFLSSLNELEELSVTVGGTKEINLSSSRKLNKLILEWRKGKIVGMEYCSKLEYLGLVDFKEEDCSIVNKFPLLKTLRIKTSTIRSVSGVESYKFLENMLLASCGRLKSIQAISNHENLKSLWIEDCKKITDFHELKNLPSLEKLLIIDCGEIPSLSFLEEMPSLKELRIVGKTKILDGDFSLTQGIQTVVLP
jgi:hypothetical protein